METKSLTLPTTHSFTDKTDKIPTHKCRIYTAGKLDCVVCLDKKPAKSHRFCRVCKGSVCAGCYRSLSSKPDHQVDYNGIGDKDKVNIKCPMCRTQGAFGEKGKDATKIVMTSHDNWNSWRVKPYLHDERLQREWKVLLKFNERLYLNYRDEEAIFREAERENRIFLENDDDYQSKLDELVDLGDEELEIQHQIEILRKKNKELGDSIWKKKAEIDFYKTEKTNPSGNKLSAKGVRYRNYALSLKVQLLSFIRDYKEWNSEKGHMNRIERSLQRIKKTVKCNYLFNSPMSNDIRAKELYLMLIKNFNTFMEEGEGDDLIPWDLTDSDISKFLDRCNVEGTPEIFNYDIAPLRKAEAEESIDKFITIRDNIIGGMEYPSRIIEEKKVGDCSIAELEAMLKAKKGAGGGSA